MSSERTHTFATMKLIPPAPFSWEEKGESRRKLFSPSLFKRWGRGMSWIACFIVMLLAPALHAQIRHGASFLRLMPGPRQQGLASSSTGVLDEHYTVYANPGAAGFLREWQWSASYSRWIADVYSASVFYGQRLRLPWSRHTRVGFGVAYQGVPEFDSSQRTAAQASASDALFALSLGQPFQISRQQFALGASAKYLMSKLAQYDADTWIADIGVLYRTKRFSLLQSGGVFEHGIISAGVALTQLGPALEFIANKTPLPRTWRTGVAFNAGSHDGLQVQLALDYHRTQKEPGEFSFGGEISWHQIVALRGGYDFENRLISPIAFGVSFRFADHKMPLHGALPGRNNALRFDLAAAEDNLLFSRPYRGGITHHGIGPESFGWGGPAHGAIIESDSVMLTWESTRDPDLYDDAQYVLLVDQDSLALAQAVALAEREGAEFFDQQQQSAFRVNQKLTATNFLLAPLRRGKYFWSVLAYDSDRHVRVIGSGKRRLNMFQIVAPDAEIKAITFDYHPWITEDEYQGKINVTVANAGLRKIAELTLALYDSAATLAPLASKDGSVHGTNQVRQLLGRLTLVDLQPGESRTLVFDWQTPRQGWHQLAAVLDEERRVFKAGAPRQRNANFCTIPKGKFLTGDTVAAFVLSRFAYEVPFIPEVCFEPGSAEVSGEYVSQWVLEPPLQTLAARMKANAQAKITLQGFADPNSNEHDAALANARAEAVRAALVQLGVRADQMRVLPGQVLPLRRTPANPEDARWVMHERRYVQIATETVNESALFDLVAFDDIEALVQPVTFLSAISGATPLRTGELLLSVAAAQDSVALADLLHGAELQGELLWRAKAENRSRWQNQSGVYAITLTDSLQRAFRTRPRATFLAAAPQLRAQRVAWPIRFNVTAPMYDFYWSKLFKHINHMLLQPNMRMRFSGHACAIGPEAINLRLSQRRSEDFQQSFLRYAQAQYADSFQKITARTDAAKGFGETKPMAIDRLNGEQIIKGENQSPLGRKLNRRIEVEFYYP
jgi:outer membrane protein OmpA-like peptidoglycan-associated protein